MKKNVLTAILLTAVLAAGQAFAASHGEIPSDRKQAKWERSETRGENMRGRQLGHLTRMLDLSAEQQEQIQAIYQEHRAKVAPLRQQLGESRKGMHALVKEEAFDENAARTLAAGQADTRTELQVERARMFHQVYSVLTPEQRALAQEKWDDRKQRRGEFRPGKQRR